jgi:chromate transporter
MNKGNLKELGRLFLKLGIIAYGGPAAHIAMMENEVVRRKKWMTHEHFLDLVGITNLIPGPNSTEMTMHCGHHRAGWKGLVIAGCCFILPAVLITGIISWLYQSFGRLPEAEPFLYGIRPAVLSIIFSAFIPLFKKAVKDFTLGMLGLITFLACLSGVHEILALFSCGILGTLIYAARSGKIKAKSFPLVLAGFTEHPVTGHLKIFLIFLKIGAVLYGSGYVLFAFLDAELVEKGYLSRQLLIDAIAVGQFTPGPVLSSATFVGWQMGGISAALLATAGIFLPSFLFVAILSPWVPALRRSPLVASFLDAVNVASVALILVVCVDMSRDLVTDWRSLMIAGISLVAVVIFKTNSLLIVTGGALLGYLMSLI